MSQSFLPNFLYQAANNRIWRLTGLIFPAGVDKCLYYWFQEYFLKRDCFAFQEDLNSNCIYLNEEKKIYLGTYLPAIRLVFMWQKKPERDCIADMEKLYYSILLPANIQTLKIREIDPNPYFSNKKVRYNFLDKPIEAKILGAFVN